MNREQPREFHCPTCGARQVASPECRRCKCDLSLVVAAHERMRAWHQSTLAHLRAGRHAEALHAARSRYALSPDAEAGRLLGVCLLLLGRFAAALEVYDAWR